MRYREQEQRQGVQPMMGLVTHMCCVNQRRPDGVVPVPHVYTPCTCPALNLSLKPCRCYNRSGEASRRGGMHDCRVMHEVLLHQQEFCMVHTHKYIHIYIYKCTGIYIHICMCVCIYVCAYIYILY